MSTEANGKADITDPSDLQDFPDLPAFKFLDDRKIAYKKMAFSPETEKGAANVARALGFAERAMVKTLIFEVDTGECALIMVGANQNAISGHLKKVLGSRNIKMASPEKVIEVTGYPIGSIPPFHWQPNGFRTFLESSLMGEAALGVGTGRWGQEIIITPSDLVLACQAQVVNLTDREQPIFAA